MQPPVVSPDFVQASPRADAQDYRFGDIIAANWLVALYLADDAKSIFVQKAMPDGSQKVFLREFGNKALHQDPSKNLVQAHADDEPIAGGVSGHARDTLPRRAMILSDDCEIVRSNRVLVAPVLPLPTVQRDRDEVLKNEVFSRYAVATQGEPEGYGFKIDFSQAFTVAVEAIHRTAIELEPASRAVRQKLLGRWASHAVRHGPRIAFDGTTKLAKLIEAGGVAAECERLKAKDARIATKFETAVRPLRAALDLAWGIEGPLFDQVADEFDVCAEPYAAVENLVKALEALEAKAREARDGLTALLQPPSGQP